MSENSSARRRLMQQRIERAKVGLIRAGVGVVGAARLHAEHDEFLAVAPLLLGKSKDSPRKWIMALGHGAAILDEKGVRGKVDYTERVIRDKQYKVWVSEQRQISQLYDLRSDPFEEKNLIGSTRPEHLAAIGKFQDVVDSMPAKDNRPQYKPRKPNPWDKKLPTKSRKRA